MASGNESAAALTEFITSDNSAVKALTIRVGRKAYHIKPGDGLWLPEGTKLVYEAKGKARVMFAVWPVDYKKRHGLE